MMIKRFLICPLCNGDENVGDIVWFSTCTEFHKIIFQNLRKKSIKNKQNSNTFKKIKSDVILRLLQIHNKIYNSQIQVKTFKFKFNLQSEMKCCHPLGQRLSNSVSMLHHLIYLEENRCCTWITRIPIIHVKNMTVNQVWDLSTWSLVSLLGLDS